ncbi:MAG: dTDP-4-dehydrorhamnose reductase [uncultured bacterium]|nr:MAG: dTDP-4-dehydrorhamnose reductase [uncultured bacterium]
MIKIIDDACYEVSEMTDSDRYWFHREFCDLRHGRTRYVLVALEKAGWQGPDLISGLSWNISIEDRGIKQTWRLVLMKLNGEDKLVFERFSKTRDGIKEETFGLAYLPAWVVDEISQVAVEMKQRQMDSGGMNFLNNLVTKIEQEKTVARAGLSAKVEELGIGGLYHILSPTRGDERGSFREVARFPEVELLTGYDFVGKQVNHSFSTYGILRGFHVEPWAKLVTVVSGLALSYLIDCRPGSRTFGKIAKVYLGYGRTPEGEEIKGGALFIEPGIGNSVLTLSNHMDYSYVVDDLWRPDTALYAVNPMDPKLAVPWTDFVPADKIVRSERDQKSPTFEEFTRNMKVGK